MKSNFSKCALVLFLLSAGIARGFCQAFTNLNFESANIPSGTQPNSSIDISSAMPGWSAYQYSSQTGTEGAPVYYDEISGGGPIIALDDKNASAGPGLPFTPLQGKYSAVLQGGGPPLGQYSVTISQTGLVPAGTESLQVYVGTTTQYLFPVGDFIVALGGQTIDMVPLQTFSTYTVYGGDVSAFANNDETLSFTSLPPVGTPPSMLILGNIQFLTSPVPEPGTLSLLGTGATLLGLRRGRKYLP
jgi:hypothetical protein